MRAIMIGSHGPDRSLFLDEYSTPLVPCFQYSDHISKAFMPEYKDSSPVPVIERLIELGIDAVLLDDDGKVSFSVAHLFRTFTFII